MRTFILSILLVAVIAVGILVTLNPIRERFLNAIVPYSGVGTAALDNLKATVGDLTPIEITTLTNMKYKLPTDPKVPIGNSQAVGMIAYFRENAKKATKKIAEGDYSVSGTADLTLEEGNIIMTARQVSKTPESAPMTPQEMKIISDKRRAYAAVGPSYSDVGTGDASTIKGWGDLTPAESAVIKQIRVYRNTKYNQKMDVNGPLDANDRNNIGMFRSGASTIQNNIAKGDFTVAGPNPGSITVEESKEFMDTRSAQGVDLGAPMTAQETQKISDRRRAFATLTPVPVAATPTPVPVAATPTPVPVAATPTPVPVAATPSPVPTTASYPTLTAEPAASSLLLTPDETAAVLKMRKAAAVQQARALLATSDDYSLQDSYPREHRNYERDDEYDYKSNRDRRQYGNDYPDMECQNCCD